MYILSIHLCIYVHNQIWQLIGETFYNFCSIIFVCFLSLIHTSDIFVTFKSLCFFSLSVCRFTLLNVCILQIDDIELTNTRISLFFLQTKPVTEWPKQKGHFSVIVYWLLNKKHQKGLLKGFAAIALFRSIRLSNSEDHKQALLANNNSKDLLNFSFLLQLYHLGKMNLNLQFILDLPPHQLRYDEVSLNRSGFLSD